MNDPRRSAELAVIEAAEAVVNDPRNVGKMLHGLGMLQQAVANLRALDSLPAVPVGETERVRIAVYRHFDRPECTHSAILEPDDVPSEMFHWPLNCIVTADIPTKPPAAPEIKGDVE